jgi:hypothetical protein
VKEYIKNRDNEDLQATLGAVLCPPKQLGEGLRIWRFLSSTLGTARQVPWMNEGRDVSG